MHKPELTPNLFNHYFALLASLLLHLVFFYFLFQSAGPKLNKPFSPMNVKLVSPSEIKFKRPKPRIVPENISNSKQNPTDTDQLSSHDSSVDKEQLLRQKNPLVSKSSSPPANKIDRPKEVSKNKSKPLINESGAKNQTTSTVKNVRKSLNSPKLDLNLNSKLLIPLNNDDPKKISHTSRGTSSFQNNKIPFSRSPGQGARFLNSPLGVNDFLPNLPDGDLTLLNAKADRFATFVRRVALRVFASLRQTGWQRLTMSQISKITKEAIITVELDKTGEIVTSQTINSSGSLEFDQSLKLASKSSRDPNPPVAAFNSNGKLKLQFHARTWMRIVPSRSSGMREERWLYLGTALY